MLRFFKPRYFLKPACLAVVLLLSMSSQAARWWQLTDDEPTKVAIDLDSFLTTQQNGESLTSTWLRLQLPKAKSIPHPVTGKNLIASGASMLVQVNCANQQIRIAELQFEDRKYRSVLKLSEYPEMVDALSSADFPIGSFYYAHPDSDSAGYVQGICNFRQLLDDYALTPDDLQLDDDGHLVDITSLAGTDADASMVF